MKVLFIILLSSIIACSESSEGSPSINEQTYEVATLSKHGFSCNFYFHFSINDKNLLDQNQIDQIHIRLDEELSKIADESTVIDLVNAIDSIGLRIENEINDEFDLRNLSVLEIGVEKSTREYLVNMEANVKRVKVVTFDEVNNYAGSTKFKLYVKSTSEDLSLVLKTKYDSEVLIEYVIYFSSQNNFDNPIESLDEHVKNTIVDSLQQYDMYEMWATKRSSLHLIMENIIKNSYPDTYEVEIRDVVIPEEAEKQFLETDKARQAIIDSLFKIDEDKKLLTQELETNKDLTEDEILTIEKEIRILENNRKTIQNEGKLLTRDYKL